MKTTTSESKPTMNGYRANILVGIHAKVDVVRTCPCCGEYYEQVGSRTLCDHPPTCKFYYTTNAGWKASK